jgi:exopolysaccharide biosynthesis polyprenyl glycosylphosphotransferase
MQTMWKEFKISATEFKKVLERDLLLRRYQMLIEGETPFEDKIIDNFTKVQTLVVTSWRSLVKRYLDLFVSIFAIAILLPVMVVVAAAIKISSRGPILYKQARVGKKGKIFNMLKFRTMQVDAETQTGPVWARSNDPRVTKIGLFLRTTHLDEIPQFFNVLKGDMSIVGPRPERPYFVSEFRKTIPHYDRRLCAKPGITGLAQIKRRYDETLADVKRKLRYDVLYIHKMCPLLDVKVMILTLGAVFLRTGR